MKNIFFVLIFSLFALNSNASITYTDPNANDFNISLATGQSTQLQIQIDSDDVADEIVSTRIYGSGLSFQDQCIQQFTAGNETCTATVTIEASAVGTKRVEFREGTGARERITFTITRTNDGTIAPEDYAASFSSTPESVIDLGTVSDFVYQNIYVRNSSAQPTDTIAPITVSTQGYSILSNSCSGNIIGAGSNCRILVKFDANSSFGGTFNQDLLIHPVSDNSAPFTVSLTAFVVEPPRAKTEINTGFTKVDPQACLGLGGIDPKNCYYESDGVAGTNEIGNVFCNQTGDCSVSITQTLANEPVQFLISVNFKDDDTSSEVGEPSTNFDFTLSPETDNVGQVLLGTKTTRTIVLTNTGTNALPGPITVTPTVSGGAASVLVNNNCAAVSSLAVSSTCSISVSITPVLQGTTTVSLAASSISGVSKTATITTTTDNSGYDFTLSSSSASVGINANDSTTITITNSSANSQNLNRPMVATFSGTGLTVDSTNSTCLNTSTGLALSTSCTLIIVNAQGASTVFPQNLSISTNGVTKNVSVDTSAILHTLAITNSGGGSISNNINSTVCSSGCNIPVVEASSITLTANPSSGKVFNGWGGDCSSSGTNSTCTLSNVTSGKTVSASFIDEPVNPTLTLNFTGNPQASTGESVQVFEKNGGSLGPLLADCNQPTCVIPVTLGKSVYIQPNKAPNSTYTISGACSATYPGICDNLLMDTNKTVDVVMTLAPIIHTVSIVFTPYTTSGGGYTADSAVIGSPELETPIGSACTSGTCHYSVEQGNQAVIQVLPGQNGATVKSRIAAWGGDCSAVSSGETVCVIPNVQSNKLVNIEMEYINGLPQITPSSVADLNEGETVQFDITGGDPVSVSYEIVGGSSIGSTIVGGLYTAGSNTTGSTVSETIRATDGQGATDEVSVNVLQAAQGLAFSLDSNTVNFGNVFTNQVKSAILQVTNTGGLDINLPLTVNKTSGNGSYSVGSSGCGQSGTLVPTQTCSLEIVLQAGASPETLTASLDITGTDGSETDTKTVSVSGDIISAGSVGLALSVSSVSFNLLKGEAKEQKITVTNVGSEPLEAYNFSVGYNSIPLNGDFFAFARSNYQDSQYNGCSDYGYLATGQTCEIFISYNSNIASIGSGSENLVVSMYTIGGGQEATAPLTLSVSVSDTPFKLRPSTINISPNTQIRLALGGGKGGPYTVDFSGVGSVSSIDTETSDPYNNPQSGYHETEFMTFSSPSEGTATVTVTDGQGNQATSTITVQNQFGVAGGFTYDPLIAYGNDIIVVENGPTVDDDEIFIGTNGYSVMNIGRRSGVVKFLGTGQLDTTFGGTGRSESLTDQMNDCSPQYPQFSAPWCINLSVPYLQSSEVGLLDIDSSGNIYHGTSIAGLYNSGTGTYSTLDIDALISKFTPSGYYDSSFGSSGTYIFENPGETGSQPYYQDYLKGLRVNGNNLYLFTDGHLPSSQGGDGSSYSYLNVLNKDSSSLINSTLINSNGSSLYHTLDDLGHGTVGTNYSYPRSIEVLPSGDILGVSVAYNVISERDPGQDIVLWSGLYSKMDSSGNFVNSFGTDGDGLFRDWMLPQGPAGIGGSSANKLLVDGNYFYSISRRNNDTDTGVVSVIKKHNTSDGSLVSSFGNNGEVKLADLGYPENKFPYSEKDSMIQPDGKIVLSYIDYYGSDGGSFYRLNFWRINSDGTLDSSFGDNGHKKIKLGADNYSIYGMAATSSTLYVGLSMTIYDAAVQGVLSYVNTRAEGYQSFGRAGLLQLDINTGDPLVGSFDDLIKFGYTCNEKGDFNKTTGECSCDAGFQPNPNSFEYTSGSCFNPEETNCGGTWTGTACDCGPGYYDMGGYCEEIYDWNNCVSNGGNLVDGYCQCAPGYIEDPYNPGSCMEDTRISECQNAGGTWDSNSEYCDGLDTSHLYTYYEDCVNAGDQFSCDDCLNNQGGYIWDDNQYSCVYSCGDAYDFITCEQYNQAGAGCYWDSQSMWCN